MYASLIKYFNSYASKPLTGEEIDLIQLFFNSKDSGSANIFCRKAKCANPNYSLLKEVYAV